MARPLKYATESDKPVSISLRIPRDCNFQIFVALLIRIRWRTIRVFPPRLLTIAVALMR
jgi:hypothetical protein